MNDQTLVLDSLSAIESKAMSFSERVTYLKKYGVHTQAFSTLQPDMQYFDIPGVGYIAFMKKWGNTYVLSDPVCDPKHFPLMLYAFHKKHPNASYIQTSKPVADFLHEKFGLFGTQFGSEMRIDLTNWSLKGKKKQVLRTAINQSEKQGIVVKECFSDDHTKEISEAWIKTRKCKSNEIRFLIRPMSMPYRENERRFYAYQDGKPVGFAFFDPIYKDGEIISYVPNISRACASFKQGLFYTLMTHAMEVFKAEGVPALDLGLIPLYVRDEIESQESKSFRWLMKQTYEHANFLYNWKGLAFSKTRFRGETESIYVCHSSPLPLYKFFSFFKMVRVI